MHLAFLRKARFKRIHHPGDRLGFTQSGLLRAPRPSALSGARHLRNGTQPTWKAVSPLVRPLRTQYLLVQVCLPDGLRPDRRARLRPTPGGAITFVNGAYGSQSLYSEVIQARASSVARLISAGVMPSSRVSLSLLAVSNPFVLAMLDHMCASTESLRAPSPKA